MFELGGDVMLRNCASATAFYTTHECGEEKRKEAGSKRNLGEDRKLGLSQSYQQGEHTTHPGVGQKQSEKRCDQPTYRLSFEGWRFSSKWRPECRKKRANNN